MATAYVPYAGPIVTRAAALAAGDRLFFTGKKCRHGHMAQRYVAQGLCVECARSAAERQRANDPMGHAAQVDAWRKANQHKVNATSRAWVEANREARKAYEKAWRAANRETITAKTMAWRAANRERWDAAAKVWQQANREHIATKRLEWRLANLDRRRQTNKAWRQENIERLKVLKKAWLAANTLRTRCYAENRRARKKANGGSHTPEQIEELHSKQRYRCVGCKASIRNHYEVDHIIPVSKGGTNDISNIQLLCVTCNRSKYTKSQEQWAREQGRLL